MNTSKKKQNTILDYSIIITLIILIPVLLFVFINPINQKFITLSMQNEKLEDELISIRSNFKSTIEKAHAKSKYINEKTKDNWEKIKSTIRQINTLSADDTFRSINEDAIIDYKISLFNTDIMLREEAASYNMILPESIGLPEEVEEKQNIEVLLDQLSVISRLTRLAMKSGVKEIVSIGCYPPKEYLLTEEENAIVTEYPININIIVSYKELLNLLINFNKKGTFTAVSEIEILKADKFNKDILYVDLVCSSFGFNERHPEDGYINNETVNEFLKELEQTRKTSPGRRGRTRGSE
jgi:hypothetical protein